ncbi:MAG: hypothetical protein D6706_20610 [Chloroflexi bacterium]|nr:MAG: hypothetical protein D6706_20610 [Chloroflexota bacterium]
MVTKREDLEEAVSILEANRALLGDAVVDVAVSALRRKLFAWQDETITPGEQFEQAVALVADLSGFTAMSELMDAEEVRDTVNALWLRLDSVIEAWGGRIDKHTGDGLIALFGVPERHEDDAKRAIMAALDMQVELRLFNEQAWYDELSHEWGVPDGEAGEASAHHRLQMRIGIHQGGVVLGKVGQSESVTAVGDAVVGANLLERIAPVGSVVISEAIFSHVQDMFDVEPLEDVVLPGNRENSVAYLVRREKPRAFRVALSGVAGVFSRFVGRTEEVAQLQFLLQETQEKQMAQLVMVIGDAGVGKTRLLSEFEHLLGIFPARICLFKGRSHRWTEQLPFALIRDLFTNYFDIHLRSRMEVAREKLTQGIMELMQDFGERARERAHFIGQLLGFDFSDSPYLQGAYYEPDRLRLYAFRDVAALLTAVTEQYDAIVWYLEDVHWADEASLNLIDFLVQDFPHIPLFVVCLARPTLLEKRPSWQILSTQGMPGYVRLDLAPLSLVDSHHLLGELLQNIPLVPNRLIDTVAAAADGNPLYIEEAIRLLIDRKIIEPDQPQWQVHPGKLHQIHLPRSLEELMATRFAALPDEERQVLQMAAIFGRIFWDSGIRRLNQQSHTQLSDEQVDEIIAQLEQKELIFRQRTSILPGHQEYIFRHDSLLNVTYDSISEEQKVVWHARVAEWFMTHVGGRMIGDALVIAYHHLRAGNQAEAEYWLQRMSGNVMFSSDGPEQE